MGGETVSGAGATDGHTYRRVDIYDPRKNTWREGPPLRTGRHGIFPVTDEGMIVVAGGGVVSGSSRSGYVETVWPSRPVP